MSSTRPQITFLTKVLLIASASISVASCATPGPTRLSSPSAVMFVQEDKPVPDLAILRQDSQEGYRQHQKNKDEWGQRGWDKLNDVCRWFEDQGVKGLPCKGDSDALKR